MTLDAKEYERRSKLLADIGWLLTACYALPMSLYVCLNIQDFYTLEPNEVGDFFAGVFGPVATFWLVLGFFQQRIELQQSTAALLKQAEELANSVQHQEAMAATASEQLADARSQVAASRLPNFAFVVGEHHMRSAFDVGLIISIINTGEACTALQLTTSDYENADLDIEQSKMLMRGQDLETVLHWDIEDAVMKGRKAIYLDVSLSYTSIDIKRFIETWTLKSELVGIERRTAVISHTCEVLEQ